MSSSESFHHYCDGRGKRRVYVNGNEIKRVVWCDTLLGIAVFCPAPLRVNRAGDGAYTRRLRGAVTVERVD